MSLKSAPYLSIFSEWPRGVDSAGKSRCTHYNKTAANPK